MQEKLLSVYRRMHRFFGDLNWWPADSAFEVIIGAILTQNTAWSNVEKAIANLKKADLLELANLQSAGQEELAQLIRPSGYFNQKAKKLKAFTDFLEQEYSGCLEKLSAEPLKTAREKLLGVNGIGPETADSILLYAFNKPVFVVDAYTRRIFSRHGFFPETFTYHQMQDFMMEHLPLDASLFNEFHAQIVYTGKNFCKPKPNCKGCPLEATPLTSMPQACNI